MSSPCNCVYIEVPFELLSSGGEQLYIVYTDCNGNEQNDNTGILPSIVSGGSLVFYVCSFLGNTPNFKYGFFGDMIIPSGNIISTK